MKKSINFVLIITIILLICPSVYAKPITKDRNSSENYGVNKKWNITDNNINNIINTPYVDASEKIYDFAEIITPVEEMELKAEILAFIADTGMDMVILTDSRQYTYDDENETYAVDFYDYNDFGIEDDNYDGVILYRNAITGDPYYNVYTFGDAQLYFTYERCETMLDAIYPYISTGDYYNGFHIYINYMKNFYSEGIPSSYDHYYVDEDGYLHKKYEIPFAVATLISAITSAIAISVMIKKNKMVKSATRAAEYMDTSSVLYTERSDRFITSHTSSYTVSSSSSGGSGGGFSGGSRSGSSGGGHGGGGGRHG